MDARFKQRRVHGDATQTGLSVADVLEGNHVMNQE